VAEYQEGERLVVGVRFTVDVVFVGGLEVVVVVENRWMKRREMRAQFVVVEDSPELERTGQGVVDVVVLL
jgi:hypothetical protein